MTRILVCGGRDFNDRLHLEATLDKLIGAAGHPDAPRDVIITGKARGADTLAEQWAISRGHAVQSYPANWGRYGRSAGIIRNMQMLNTSKPSLVIAFPGGKGTSHMKSIAREAGIKVVEA